MKDAFIAYGGSWQLKRGRGLRVVIKTLNPKQINLHVILTISCHCYSLL